MFEEIHKLQSTGVPIKKDRVVYGSSQRIKRQGQPSRFCPILVAADHLFQSSVGRENSATSVSEIVSIVSQVQDIFAATDFGVGGSILPVIGRVYTTPGSKCNWLQI